MTFTFSRFRPFRFVYEVAVIASACYIAHSAWAILPCVLMTSDLTLRKG